MKKIELHWQILIAIGLAGIAGWAVNSAIASGIEDPSFIGISFIGLFDYVGSLFLNALKMIIVPLIFSSIVMGVAGIGSGGNLGVLG
ncbi:MAG: cation:dicarboxylase symporter family transporter, partial [Woeseiaceae bacterium]|nr:cation:dicarboxylase symporter family transporter [Woeseiaceae bacterium]